MCANTDWPSPGTGSLTGISILPGSCGLSNAYRAARLEVPLEPDSYYARYSKNPDAVPYFSPMYETSFVLKPVLEITHYDLYDVSLKSYIYADAGVYKEHGFATYYPIGGVSYAQELKTSKTFSLKWLAGHGARVYDGRYTNVLELFFSVNKYF